ncbi:MAG: trehalase family glycosidase [Kiritimatiellaeota bacterium]|nr:trehalase family glycosidase [Kiritimatiellota bacterium]
MTKKTDFLWQPFVPCAGANAQAVFDLKTGAAVDIFILAGVKVAHHVKRAQVFIQHPGLHSSDIEVYTNRHIQVNEVAYNAAQGYWRFEFLHDAAKRHYIEAACVVREDNRLLIELTAHNRSTIPAKWVITLLAGVNQMGKNVVMDSTKIKLPNRKEFTCYSDPPLDAVPAIRGLENVYLDGVLVDWGRKEERQRYPHGFLIHHGEWPVAAGASSMRRIVCGTPQKNKGKIKVLDAKRKAIVHPAPAKSVLERAIEHLTAQLTMNRRYPPSKKSGGAPFPVFTPCASMEIEYLWDAGFVGVGLAACDPTLAEACIRQYLPAQPQTIWPQVIGAAVPIQIIAAWELFQQTRTCGALRRMYPGLHELWLCAAGYHAWPGKINLDRDQDGLILAPGGGSGLDDAPSQIWGRGYGIGWARQDHYWTNPIAVNDTGKCIPTESVNMTAFVVLCAKLLKQMSAALKQPASPKYDEFIRRAERALQAYCWNGKTGHFHWVVEQSHAQCPYYDLSGLTPLFSGSYRSDEQKNNLIRRLTSQYLTPLGLTTVDRQADFYRQGYWCGAVWFPFQWLFWKWFMGQGRFREAHTLAHRFLKAYALCYAHRPASYEKIDLETRKGGGDLGFGGLAAPLVNIWAAYHKPGTVSFGFGTTPLAVEITPDLTSATIVVESGAENNDAGGLVVLAPSRKYLVSSCGRRWTRRSNAQGMLEFTFLAREKRAEITIKAE